MTVQITLLLNDIVTLYDDYGFRRISIDRSDDGGLDFYPVTHECCAVAPQLIGTTIGPWDLDGKHLIVDIDGIGWDVEFTGSGDWDLARVQSWLEANSPLRASAGSGGRIVVDIEETGSAHYITPDSCSAGAAFGFTPYKVVYGYDAGLPLYRDTINYTFFDSNGQPGYLYRYRLVTESGEFSRWSQVITATHNYEVGDDEICRCWVRLVDQQGQPLADTRVYLGNYWGMAHGTGWDSVSFRQTMTTDADGRAEVHLLRGLVVDVAVEGSAVTRRVQIPDQPEANLLDPGLAVYPDEVAVQEYAIPAAVVHS